MKQSLLLYLFIQKAFDLEKNINSFGLSLHLQNKHPINGQEHIL